MSRREELLEAFSAFDADDSGQIDVNELREALCELAPEPGSGERMLSAAEVNACMEGFVGRRGFKKAQMGNGGRLGGKGDVFRYYDFVGGIWGGAEGAGGH